MDLAHQYHRPSYLTRGGQEEDSEESHQRQQLPCPTPYYFEHDNRPRTPLQVGPLPGLNANLFSQAATSKTARTIKEEDTLRVHNDEMQRAFESEQDFRRQLSQAETWQGDWQLASAALGPPPLLCSPQQENIDQIEKQSLDLLTSANNLQSLMTAEDRQNLELNSQELIEAAASSIGPINEPLLAKQVLPPMSSTTGSLMASKNLEHYAMPFTEAPLGIDNGGQQQQHHHLTPINEALPLLRPNQLSAHQCPPHSAPPTMHTHYPNTPPSPHSTSGRNSIFSFCPDPITGEVGWMVEQQTSRFQMSPLLNGKVKFPTRPLMPGVLAKIHNEWLDEFPEPGPEGEEDWEGKLMAVKRFPTPQMTFESEHVRTLWQELERRRILEIDDRSLLHRLRMEAIYMIKLETAHRASAGVNGLSQEELFESIPDPPEDQINHKTLLLWEQTKRSAIYAVGLLRQAEYCIAQGNLGFMPLNNIRQSTGPTETNREAS